MAIITLTTDFGIKDHFVGALKGSIYKELADVKIVDISHGISPFNIQECAYILSNAYKSFPDGTIHIVGVDAEPTRENQHIAVFLDGHYFITANNGYTIFVKSKKIELSSTVLINEFSSERIQRSISGRSFNRTSSSEYLNSSIFV